MKTLLILRHAKAEPPDENMTDHARPLAKRGHKDAPRIGAWLVEQGLMPDAILSSDALRARTTAKLVADACRFSGELQLFASLYMAMPETYLEVVAAAAEEAARVLVVGHNPTLDDLLFLLTGSHDGFPTAGLAVVELDVASWSEVRLPTRHRLAHFVRGKELPDD